MVKIFLDTNIFIDLFLPRNDFKLDSFDKNNILVSSLSAHILSYVNKVKIPSQKLNDTINSITLTSFDEKILKLALQGPTDDLEDNIQLHSAAGDNCDYFLTRDQGLLELKFFGKLKIVSSL